MNESIYYQIGIYKITNRKAKLFTDYRKDLAFLFVIEFFILNSKFRDL